MDLVEIPLIADLVTRGVAYVERIDRRRAEGLDLGRGDVEIELVQRSGDAPEHAHGIGSPHLEHRGIA